MDADDYQKQALRTEHTPLFVDVKRKATDTNDESAWNKAIDHDRMLSRLLHAVLGMITELGELCDPLKRHLIYGADLDTPRKPGEQTPRENMREEIGDKSWYGGLAADALGAKFGDILERNIAKLRARFPDRFTQDKALNRDLDAEHKALEGNSTIGLPDGRKIALLDYRQGTQDDLKPTAVEKLEASDDALIDRIIRAFADTHDTSALWGHLRDDPHAFRSAVERALVGYRENAPGVPRSVAELPPELSARLRMLAKGTFTNIQFQVARELKRAAIEAADNLERRRASENLSARDVREAMGVEKPQDAEWTWDYTLDVIRRARSIRTDVNTAEWQRCADILACENKPETIIKCLRILVDANQANVLKLEALREANRY